VAEDVEDAALGRLDVDVLRLAPHEIDLVAHVGILRREVAELVLIRLVRVLAEAEVRERRKIEAIRIRILADEGGVADRLRDHEREVEREERALELARHARER